MNTEKLKELTNRTRVAAVKLGIHNAAREIDATRVQLARVMSENAKLRQENASVRGLKASLVDYQQSADRRLKERDHAREELLATSKRLDAVNEHAERARVEVRRANESARRELIAHAYYRDELTKAHTLIGRITQQLAERWDSVRLTEFFPTDNPHGKRTVSDPGGEYEKE